MIDFCRTCGGPIIMMIQQNTGFCCQHCADEYAAAHLAPMYDIRIYESRPT